MNTEPITLNNPAEIMIWSAVYAAMSQVTLAPGQTTTSEADAAVRELRARMPDPAAIKVSGPAAHGAAQAEALTTAINSYLGQLAAQIGVEVRNG